MRTGMIRSFLKLPGLSVNKRHLLHSLREDSILIKWTRTASALNPIQILVLGYFLIVLVISLLLMLPISNARGQSQSFIDAFFMASSGISTTGLSVVNVGEDYSFFGQIILLIDFQIGGIGYMALFIFLGYLLQVNFSLRSQLIAGESMAGGRIGHNDHFFKKVIFFTLLFELSGGLILGVYWMKDFPFAQAFYQGMFHAISAFCTAGFSLFPDSLTAYSSSFLVNAVIVVLSLAGGIGFLVLNEVSVLAKMKMAKKRISKLSTHTRLAIFVTLILITASSLIIFFSEKWPSSLGLIDKGFRSSFQAISASTTDGFNTINISHMSMSSLLVIILLMLTGASPGSTGGGIKTTTLGTIFLSIKAQLTGQKDTNFFKRRISEEIIRKSFSIFFLFSVVMIVDLLLMTTTEKSSFLETLFEAASALGNTGLSMGITSSLSRVGKLALSLTMFIGRVGPLTIGMALIGKSRQALFSYAEADIFVG